ncbi:MAG: DUF2911 domain-containing protein [Opitutaceae bacterium]|jgi:hypothetical protein|nr:DUF2911 domain-containing protein [Opitutaceae bacterium]
MNISSAFRLVRLGLIAALAASPALAQNQINFPAPSPSATVKQTVGLTNIEINYSRPAAKGRQVFGGLVQYDQVWRTGANESTKITFDGPIEFGGVAVPAGTYAIYSVPGRDTWEVMLSSNAELFGSYGYSADADVARVTVNPTRLATPLESLAISFEAVVDDSARLNIAWANVQVSVEITADTQDVLVPQIKAVMAGDGDKKPYFPAAMYYYAKGIHLKQAAKWITTAAEQNPDAFWVSYRQGLVLAAAGDKAGAIRAAKASIAKASANDNRELREEYLRLNEALIASLK